MPGCAPSRSGRSFPKALATLGLFAASAAVAAPPTIVTRLIAPGSGAHWAAVAPGAALTVEVRIDAPALSTIGASYLLEQSVPSGAGWFAITNRSQAGSPFNDAGGGATLPAVIAAPGNVLAPITLVNLGNNTPGLAGLPPAANILVSTLTLTCRPDTPPGTYRIRPAPAVSFATEVSTTALGTDVTMGTAYFDIFVGTAPPRIDIDGNGSYDALTDGLLAIRYLFGLTGTALTNGAIGAGAARTTPATVLAFLESVRPLFDIDGNGEVDALTDGLMLIRHLFGLRGTALIAGAIGPGATRSTAEIESYIQSIMP